MGKEKIRWTFFEDQLPPKDGHYWICCALPGQRRWLTSTQLRAGERGKDNFQSWMPMKRPRLPKT